MGAPLSNWAGNYAYQAARVHRPATVAEVQELVRSCRKLRALGSRHSFNAIADTPEDLVVLDQLAGVVALDAAGQTVTVEGGITYGQLCPQLHAAGFALHNLASLPHISVAGSVATATHGSGDGNGNLATAVVALELVTADGELLALSREGHPEQFPGAVVALGGLGVVTRLTLALMPTFQVRQHVYERLPLAQLEQHFDELTGMGYSVSMFTDWSDARFNQVWLKRLDAGAGTAAATDLFGATPAPSDRHPLAGLSPINCTAQMGVPGPWHERLPHFRMEFTPSNGEELQSEYFVPRRHAVAAIHALARLRDQVAPLLHISEVRTIAADDLWLSPCYQQACVGLHFTWKPDWPGVSAVLPLIEAALAPFEARPHWGKLFTLAPEQVRARYAMLPAFQQLLERHDPQGKFRNPFLERYIFGAA